MEISEQNEEKITVNSPKELEKEEIDDEVGDLNEVLDSDSDEEDATEVEKIVWEGNQYLKDEENTVYDVETQEPIGEWLENRVALYSKE